MVLACCVIRDRPRASKKSLRVPRTIQAESAPRPLTARSTFRGRCSRATSKRKPRKYISTSRSLNVEKRLVRRTFVVENILLLIRSKTKAKRLFLARRNSWRKRKDESSSNSTTTITSFVLFREKKKTTTTPDRQGLINEGDSIQRRFTLGKDWIDHASKSNVATENSVSRKNSREQIEISSWDSWIAAWFVRKK